MSDAPSTPPGPGAGPRATAGVTGWLRRWTPAELVELAVSVAALLIVIRVFGTFGNAIELRHGVVLRDPVLALLTPRDMTALIFAVIYAAAVLAIVTLARDPPALVCAVRAYAIVFLLRMIVMAATPLDAPAGHIPLADPVVKQLVTQQVLTRDLFFSGHTATACILVFTARTRLLRAVFVVAAVVVGASVMIQHVHYTVDVLAAPAFTYVAHRIAVVTARIRRAPALLGAAWGRGAKGTAPPPDDARERRRRRVS